MINLIRRYWFLMLLATIALLLGVLWVRASRQEEVEGPALIIDQRLPKLDRPSFKGEPISPHIPVEIQAAIPENQVAAYKITPLDIAQDQALKIAAAFGFGGLPIINQDALFGRLYSWSQEGRSLFVGQAPANVVLSTESSLSIPSEGTLPSYKTAFGLVTTLLDELGLNDPAVSWGLASSKTVRDGNASEIGATPFIGNNVPVVDLYSDTPLVTAVFLRNGRFSHFVYRAGFSVPQVIASYPARGVEEIKERLSQDGEIRLLGSPSEAPQAGGPKSITITNVVSAVYFDPEKPAVLSPIFILEGVAQTEQGEVQTIIYVPAVQHWYLKTGP